MKMKTILVSILLISAFKYADSQTFQERLYSSYINNKLNEWEKIIADMQKEYNKTNNDRQLYNIIEAYYGFIGYLMTTDQHEKMDKFIETGDKYIDFLMKKYPKWAEIYAMKGAWYGFRMINAVYKAVYLGPKSMENINKALELDGNCPNAHIEKANVEFHMPPVFGGSKLIALKHYQTAVIYYEKNNKTKNNWLYLNALISMAKCYEVLNNYKEAVNVYKKILTVEPGFFYIKNSLLPSAIKKIK